MTTHTSSRLVARLRDALGPRHVLTTPAAMRRWCTGYRIGRGEAAAVVRPGSLVEMWRVLEICAAENAVLIAQAANTGLTGGSTPAEQGYDRPVVVMNTLRIDGIHLVAGGAQAICLAGSTLFDLERRLQPLGRQPHSVIGSSCIGASVVGGICNNSGGTLIRRGPAYTESALFGVIDADGRPRLVNHLGVAVDASPETLLSAVESGDFTLAADAGRACSDPDYQTHVRDCAAPTPARFNADPRRLFEAAGSAGHVVVFAVRVDTFPADRETRTFYIGAADPQILTRLRRTILTEFAALPVEAEYLHRDAFRIAERYGRDTYLAVRHLGTRRMPLLFATRTRMENLLGRLPFTRPGAFDRIVQAVVDRVPLALPPRLRGFRDRFDHHLILRMADDGIAEARRWLDAAFDGVDGAFFEATPDEAAAALQLRFCVASAAIRMQALGAERAGGLVALDLALPRDTTEWFERLPAELEEKLVAKVYYGHFFCQVFHHDYLVRAGEDVHAVEAALLAHTRARGAQCPAEHNFGHHYPAPETVLAHYRALDPTNALNPGIGQASRAAGWR
ncbi:MULTISPECIES: D-lactate dehydrogenase [unclassified Sphingomonas]|jgi:D-lactate dehydrogenase|uniref:D-lactate dehydrogenase n=1 Tax=unclassified Sphingomonas TaxID=196159 RepID=UPI0008347591|nr:MULTISPECIES: D-lactate dehydrogenase [unclassified Sphingomonas]